MKRTAILLLLLAAAAAVAVVLRLGRGDPDETPGPATPPRPPLRAEIAWPEGFPAEARETLEPLVLGLEGDEESAARSLAGLRAPEIVDRFASLAPSVLLGLRAVLEEILPAAEDATRREVVALLAAWLATTEDEARDAASEAVPLDALATALAASSSELLRREIVALLPELRGPHPFQLVLRALPDPSPAVRRAAVRALAATGDRRAAGHLRRRLAEEEDDGVRAEILRVLVREPTLRGDDLAALVRPLARGEDGAARAAAIELLGVLGDRESLGALAGALSSENRSVRLAAIVALGRLGGPEAGRALESAVDPGEEDPETSERLAWARERTR